MRWWVVCLVVSARAHRRDMQATDGHGSAFIWFSFTLIWMCVRVWESERQLLLNAIYASC